MGTRFSRSFVPSASLSVQKRNSAQRDANPISRETQPPQQCASRENGRKSPLFNYKSSAPSGREWGLTKRPTFASDSQEHRIANAAEEITALHPIRGIYNFYGSIVVTQPQRSHQSADLLVSKQDINLLLRN